MKSIKVLNIAFFILGFSQLMHSQNVLSVSGGKAIGQGGSVSYSVGQLTYQSITGTEGSILHGIQLPFEISVITGIENPELEIILSVYPNPAGDFLTMDARNYDFQKLNYQYYDINGRLLLEGKATGELSKIHLGNLKPGIYFLRISDNIKDLKTFKIIKN